MILDLAGAVNLEEIRGLAPYLYTERVDVAAAALILVDMQVAFCRPDEVQRVGIAEAPQAQPPPFDRQWMETTIANDERLLRACRDRDIPVIHVVLGSWTPGGAEMSPHKKRADLRRQSLGIRPQRQYSLACYQIIPELAPREGEIIMQKVTASAFASTGLESLLHNMGVEHLLIGGTLTHGCLGATALDASVHYGYDVTIVGDASVAPRERTAHRVWLRLFEQHLGRVCSTDEILQEIGAD